MNLSASSTTQKSLPTFTGVVQQNRGRGTTLGFPTANISIDDSAEPGVFAGWVLLGNRKLPAAIFVGVAEMFGETQPLLEAYILDFSENIYGQTIHVELVQKLRDTQSFATTEELLTAIEQDILHTRKCLQV